MVARAETQDPDRGRPVVHVLGIPWLAMSSKEGSSSRAVGNVVSALAVPRVGFSHFSLDLLILYSSVTSSNLSHTSSQPRSCFSLSGRVVVDPSAVKRSTTTSALLFCFVLFSEHHRVWWWRAPEKRAYIEQ